MRWKGGKLGEPCPKVRLSQDRFAKEPLALLESQVRGKLCKLGRGKVSKLGEIGEGECISQTNDISRCDISPTVIFELMSFRTKSVSN